MGERRHVYAGWVAIVTAVPLLLLWPGIVVPAEAAVDCSEVRSLSNGDITSTDGAVEVTVDPAGAFGSTVTGVDPQFNPIGDQNAAGTVYSSNLFLGVDGGPASRIGACADGVVVDEILVDEAQHLRTRGTLPGGLEFTLDQSLLNVDPSGSTLVQRWRLSNPSDTAPHNLRLTRHMDADLDFDGTIADGGAASSSDGATIYEFDSSDDPVEPSTYVGITGSLGGDGVPDRFTIQAFDYRGIIAGDGGIPSGDDGQIAGDDDGDLVVDEPYDVTLSQEWRTALPPTESLVLVTATRFGADTAESRRDSDGDGLLDSWENNGYTEDGVTVDLPAMGADPFVPDLFVEIDWLEEAGIDHAPDADSLGEVVDRFAENGIHLHLDFGPDAPLTYGPADTWGDLAEGNAFTTGNGGQLGTVDEEGDHAEYVWTNPGGTDVTYFDDVAQSNLEDARRRVFRYTLVVDNYGGSRSSGIARGIPASDLIVAASGLDGPTDVAATFMHELGHTLGLYHGGGEDVNWKPNYLSVMNYFFQLHRFVGDVPGPDGTGRSVDFDYSHEALADLDESSLNEPEGIEGDWPTRWLCPAESFWERLVPGIHEDNYEWHENPGGGGIDFNCDGSEEAGTRWDLNKDEDTDDVHAGHDDWANLQFAAGAVGDAGDIYEPPASTPPTDPEPVDALRQSSDVPLNALVAGGPAAVSDDVTDELPAYLGEGGQIDRVSGASRYDTAVELSRTTFDARVESVTVATGGNFADALAAGPVATAGYGPILLTPTDTLPAAVAEELERLQPANVLVAGGTNAVSDDVVAAIRSAVGAEARVDRVAGSDRFATAVALSQRTFHPDVQTVYVATGGNFPDALVAGSVASVRRSPVLLTATNQLSATVGDELARLAPARVVVAGGTAAVSDTVVRQIRDRLGQDTDVERIGGSDRYQTAAALVTDEFGPGTLDVVLATGRNYPDALAAAPVAARLGAPVAITEPGSVPLVTQELLRFLSAAAP